MKIVIDVFCLITLFAYLIVRLRYELQMMQQNSYRNERYTKWLRSDLKNINRVMILFAFVASCLFYDNLYVKILLAVFSLGGIYFELVRKYKKTLVYTNRAVRLYISASLISLLLLVFTFLAGGHIGCLLSLSLLLNVFSFVIIQVANIINAPVESSINKGYYNDAKRILDQNKQLIIIGITGSYGKTSTKHYLHRILSEKYNVLMTPGSYNTTLGVIRTIRENLKPFHEIFIVEMGAKQPGDIKEICDLVHPTIGILTSVGEQHLESFKSIENVQKTKFELIDSLPKDGLAVLNADFEYIISRNVTNVENKAYYSFSDPSVNYFIENIHYSNQGTDFTVKEQDGSTNTFSTKIVGKHNLSNILAGIIVARHLNIDVNPIKYAVSHIEQVEHRLNIRYTPGGITIIDDAFNSNPNGAEMALEVLKGFQSGQRIVVTPGMIELGDKQFEYNCKFGKQIADSADYAIIVGEYNKEAIFKGLKDTDFDEKNIYLATSFNDAVKHLGAKLTKGDVVLYENDLPDTFK